MNESEDGEELMYTRKIITFEMRIFEVISLKCYVKMYPVLYK